MLGVALVLAGLVATVAGLAIVLLVGADGSIGLPPTRIVAAGSAITLPQLDVPTLPRRASVVLDVALTPRSADVRRGRVLERRRHVPAEHP